MNIYSTVWYRYFFKRHLTLFIGCLIFLFSLFVLTDLMGHIKDIFDHKSDTSLWLQYYACMFSRRVDALVPFSLLISGTLILTTISRKNEMIPLLNAGLSLRHQIQPFFAVALIAMISMWFNSQFIFPTAIQTHDAILDSDFGRTRDKDALGSKMGAMYLQDGSKIFFQKADPANKELYDVYWLPNQKDTFADKIVHIEVVSYQKAPHIEGSHVDIIQRDKEGIFKKSHSMQLTELPDLKISEEDITMATHPAKHFSLFQLLQMSIRMARSSSEKAGDIFITLMLKLLTPLTCLLTVCIPIPYCLNFSKGKHVALLLFFFLGALFMFQLCVQTCTILAHIPGAPALLILILPWTIAGIYGIKKLKKFLSYV